MRRKFIQQVIKSGIGLTTLSFLQLPSFAKDFPKTGGDIPFFDPVTTKIFGRNCSKPTPLMPILLT